MQNGTRNFKLLSYLVGEETALAKRMWFETVQRNTDEMLMRENVDIHECVYCGRKRPERQEKCSAGVW